MLDFFSIWKKRNSIIMLQLYAIISSLKPSFSVSHVGFLLEMHIEEKGKEKKKNLFLFLWIKLGHVWLYHLHI